MLPENAANRETGADSEPSESAVIDDETAVENVAKLLELEEPTDDSDDKTTQANQETEPEADKPTDDSDDAEPIEVPDTVDDLALALGVEPDELANHLKVKVKIGGEERLISLAEARKGQQLESDYRQKTSELAEQRRVAAEQVEQAQAEWQQKLESLTGLYSLLEQQLQQDIPKEELDRLLQTDPAEYVRVQAQRTQQHEAMEKVRAAMAAEQQKTWHERQQEQHKFRQQQQKLLIEKVPEFGDAQKAQKVETRLSDGLRHFGFSDDDISGFFGGAFDHRMVMVADAAAKFVEMQKGNLTKQVKAKPKMVKPGTAKEIKSRGEETQAALRTRLRKAKGKRAQDDAAVAFVSAKL